MGGGFNAPQRIVGVVANVAEGKLTDEPEPTRATSCPAWRLVLAERRAGHPDHSRRRCRDGAGRCAPHRAARGAELRDPGDDDDVAILDTAVGPARQVMALLSLLSGLALVLGAIGIYGVIAHFASRSQARLGDPRSAWVSPART